MALEHLTIEMPQFTSACGYPSVEGASNKIPSLGGVPERWGGLSPFHNRQHVNREPYNVSF